MARNVAASAQPIGRRDFLNLLIGAAMLAWGGLTAAVLVKVVTPPARRLDGSAKLEWLEVGAAGKFTETPQAVAYGDETVYVYRLNGRLVANSGVCPHVRCVVKWEAAKGVFRCPCHASAFDKAGKRLYGPATRDLWAQRVRVQGGKVLIGGGTPPA